MLTKILTKLGVDENKIPDIIAAWLRSMWYTLCSTGSLYLLLMEQQTQGFTIDPVGWMQKNTWAFVLAQFIAPFLRAHAVATSTLVPAVVIPETELTGSDKAPPKLKVPGDDAPKEKPYVSPFTTIAPGSASAEAIERVLGGATNIPPE